MKLEVIAREVAKYEGLYPQPKIGATKRALVVDMLMLVMPFPKWLPKPLRRVVLGWLVDMTVAAYNYAYGKVWPKQMTTKAARS